MSLILFAQQTAQLFRKSTLLNESPPDVKLPQIITPNTASKKNSQEPNFNDSIRESGVSTRTQTAPNKVPRKAEAFPRKMPNPASPLCPILYPSTAVAAEAGVPGMFNRIAVCTPPDIAPTYTPINERIAVSDEIPYVNPVKRAIAIVEVNPGSTPTSEPKNTASTSVRRLTGVTS